MKPERDRVKALLTEAVTLLCKNSVTYQAEVEVEGLLGITVDRNEVFLVSLHEIISKRPDTQQMLQPQSYAQQFTSTPSYSPTPSKRKRRRKSGEGTPHQAPKKMTPTPSSDASEAIVLEDDDEESNGTIEEGAQSAQNTGDTNLDTSQGQGEPTSDTTFDDFQDTSNPAAFSDQSALGSTNTGGDNSQVNLETGDTDRLSQEQYGGDDSMPGASDGITSVKREKFDSFSPQQDDSLGGGYDSFETEQKWSATMGMMQQGDGSPGMMGGAGFAMPQGSSAQQSSNTQKGKRVRKIGTITTVLIPTPEVAQSGGDPSPTEGREEETSTPTSPGRKGAGTPTNTGRTRSGTPTNAGRRGASTPTSPGIKGKCPIDLTCGCGRKFADVSQLYYHQLDLQHFTEMYCYLCDKRFSKQSNFKRHNVTCHSLQRMAHICWVCNKSFIRYDNLQDHQLKKHSMIGCKYCHVGFPNRAELKLHVQFAHKGVK